MTKQEIREELKKLNPEQLENVLVSILEMTLFEKKELTGIIADLNKELELEKEAEKIKEEINNEENFIMVAFPSLNKNHWISDNDSEIVKSSNLQRCKVEKIVTLSQEDFKELSLSLLDSRPEMFEQIGGSRVDDDSLFNGVTAHTEEYFNIFKKHGYKMVVEVKQADSNDVFYVNTEGHSYARYVGRESIDALNLVKNINI